MMPWSASRDRRSDNRRNAAPRAEVVDSRARLRRLTWLFVGAAMIVFGRLAWMQFTDGPEFRRLAGEPIERRRWVDGVRGRILSRDGVVWAEDRPVLSVAVDYRWLVEPPDPAWLRRVARQRLIRARLPVHVRKDPRRIASEIAAVEAERTALQRRLAPLCGWSDEAWRARTAQIQAEVTQLAARVNARRLEQFVAAQQAKNAGQVGDPTGARRSAGNGWRSWRTVAQRILFPADDVTPPPPITVAEEVRDHIVATDVSLDVVAEIESRPELYPATRILAESRRHYPAGPRAAHVVGHLAKADADDVKQAQGSAATSTTTLREGELIGRMGIEAQFDRGLRGAAGMEIERSDLSGRLLEREQLRQPVTGRDLALTLDAKLQATAEALLDAALERRAQFGGAAALLPAGGAIVALDVRSGAVLAAASAPRFHPGLFQSGNTRLIAACLEDPAAPLFDRTLKMTLPPGSVFKVATAVALLEQSAFQPDEPVACQGYFRDPEHERCAIYARHGECHGRLGLEAALVRSCNVYFFEQAGALAPDALREWSMRFGFGSATGVDLPHEASGNLPPTFAPPAQKSLRAEAERAQRAAMIGQSTVTVTPLQVARFMAAVANGGRLVTPHVALQWGAPTDPASAVAAIEPPSLEPPAPHPIAGIHTETLLRVRRAMERVVSAPEGTAHASVYLQGLPIAGKTGAAEAGRGRPDHAWFAGYAPADAPRVAFVVALEHAGGGGEAAGPVARRLVQQLQQLGYLGRANVAQATYAEPASK